jgi:glutamate-1-semialdehyde 2,1-aminomutase
MKDVRDKTYPASKAWFERAKGSLAGGVSSQFRMFNSPHPMFYRRAAGSRIWDEDGNALIDFTLAQGPLILGHSHPEVLHRVTEAIGAGQLFAGQFEAEVLLAERLQQLIPAAERIRFGSSGSEAAHTVLRLARYATGRAKFIKFEGHYHGWLDSVSFSVNPPAADPLGAAIPWGGGIPESVREDVIVLPWNDLEAVERTLSERGAEIGALITEPIMANQGCIEPLPGYLAGLRELCDRFDVALIFDEIITGFRVDLGGAQRHYGITPDLAIFGKALASGFPLSAIVGRERFMAPLASSEVYHAGTLNANNASVAAALATVELLERDDAALFRRLAETGSTLRDGLRRLGEKHRLPLRVHGPGAMFHMGFTERSEIRDYRDTLDFDAARYGAFCTCMLALGVRLIGRGIWYISTAHSAEDVELGLAAADTALGMLT